MNRRASSRSSWERAGVRPSGFRFLTLFAAEEIPAAMVTYVALLMLLQLGLAPRMATFLSALLFVPWVLKSFMRPWVRRVGNFKLVLHLIEALLFAALLLLAYAFSKGPIVVFLALFLVSLLCAWHELAARMLYEQKVRLTFQRLLTVPKLVCSQIAVIFTYGALIFLVGMLEVYFRQICYSWQVGCYMVAGLFLFFAFVHLVTLSYGPRTNYKRKEPSDNRQLSTLNKQWVSLLILFLLLLPQGLMFHSRVLYLFDTHAHGGLQCTMQEIGFAQGTIGVIAFSLGIALGRWLIIRYSLQRLFWPMALSVVLSPFVYLIMTIWPPQSLLMLCLGTMSAQLLFGLGLGVCRLPVSTISGTRYRNTINMLQIPLVSAALFVPMAISGWMIELLGYGTFFLVNSLSVPVCLLGVYMLKRRSAA